MYMGTDTDDLRSWLRRHGRSTVRFVTAALLLGPGIRKFLTYDQSVEFFTVLGLPSPSLLVVVVGGIEVGAALSLFSNRAPWLGAFLALPVMAVAIATAGASWQNVSVLSGGILIIGTTYRSRRNTTG
jgi:uncharacterized membrane protein YphA (DoxX/SURF4 family)